jgi:hypothetical protein
MDTLQSSCSNPIILPCYPVILRCRTGFVNGFGGLFQAIDRSPYGRREIQRGLTIQQQGVLAFVMAMPQEIPYGATATPSRAPVRTTAMHEERHFYFLDVLLFFDFDPGGDVMTAIAATAGHSVGISIGPAVEKHHTMRWLL